MTTIPMPVEISDVQLAFPADALDYMPAESDIPKEFDLNGSSPWVKFANSWFASGLAPFTGFIPVEGVDPEMATRQLRAILGSYASRHEHKIGSVAYLCSLWFSLIIYGRAGTKSERSDVLYVTSEEDFDEAFLQEWFEHLDGGDQ